MINRGVFIVDSSSESAVLRGCCQHPLCSVAFVDDRQLEDVGTGPRAAPQLESMLKAIYGEQ